MYKHISDILNWTKAHWTQIVPVLGLLVATIGFLLTHSTRLRGGIQRSFTKFGDRLGSNRRRYNAAFLKSHRELKNIYLNRIEKLDVVTTYVPLHVIDTKTGRMEKPAIDVLLDSEEDRIVILGDPGSGKTTLLKSFGVSLASGATCRTATIGRTGGFLLRAKALQNVDLVPIYVELRDFANKLATYPTLSGYITGHVLTKHAGGIDGEVFFKNLLLHRKCVVLLDALDEVGSKDYDAVRSAVRIFLHDDTEAMPTVNARVVMTSRYQNFLNVIDDWIPSGFHRYHVLSPFSDDDIQRFLQKRAADLPQGKHPAALWDDIRSSSTLDLHRTPLILTVSLGLYIHVPRYTIPESVATFYEEIVGELLKRHDFRTRDHLSKRNTFSPADKLLFLREFALLAASRPGQFDEFTYGELTAFFETFHIRVAKLDADDRDGFLSEIIENAGLIRRVSDDGIYVYAHRSFHEYFVALQLSKNPQAATKTLIDRSSDRLWRQVILFFAAMDHDQHDSLLDGLTQTNPELAGHCLAITSRGSEPLALSIIERLNMSVTTANAVSILGALTAIGRNASESVRADALRVVGRVLTDVLVPKDATALWGLSREDLAKLARDLSTTRSRNVVNTCITLSRLVDNDPEFIAPLWSCLEYYLESARAESARQLVARILELAQTQEGFDALQARPPIAPTFATKELRSFVYPFTRGVNGDSNLVTLLAWADYAGSLPAAEKSNGFLQAFTERRSAERV